MGRIFWECVSHSLQDLHVLLLLILLGHTAWGDVIQVLQPLEVGASDTTSVGQHVWNCDDSSFKECFFSAESCWAISSFDYYLAFKLVYVVLVDSLFFSSRDEDITFLMHVV